MTRFASATAVIGLLACCLAMPASAATVHFASEALSSLPVPGAGWFFASSLGCIGYIGRKRAKV